MRTPLGPTEGGTKHQATCRFLRDLAYQCGPSAKLPTTVQLRQTLGVSISTLDAALREMEQQNIIQRRQGSGLFVAPELQKSIALVCNPTLFQDSGSSAFWNLLVSAARERAAEKNEVFSFHFSAPEEHRGSPLPEGLMSDIGEGRVHGVLCVGVNATLWETTPLMEERRVPVVVFAGAGRWGVQLNSTEVIHRGVEELARQGCQKIGLWSAILPMFPILPDKSDDSWPVEPFRTALGAQGLPFDAAQIEDNRHLIPAGGGYVTQTVQEQGFETARKIFGGARHTWPDGLVVTHDLMAHGALVALRKLGVEVGQDVKLASHANRGSPILMGREDDLTLIEFDPAEVVGNIFEMLETLMDGQVPTQSKVLIAPRLRVRRD